MSEKEIAGIVDIINKSITDNYPNTGKAILEKTSGGGTPYRVVNYEPAYVIKRVYESDSLSQEQADYLLTEVFGISDAELNQMKKEEEHRQREV